MEINLTFCIQVINFFLFYQGISYFFLKPFVTFIQAKMASRDRILADFAIKEAHLKALAHTKIDIALQFKQMLKEKYALPVVSEISMHDEKPLGSIAEEQQKSITTQLVNIVVTRIKDAY
ncbi:hypothetical protein FJ364_00740 [Candidatus Dependentiae bacterium]|nr:hypothetical protein [Candidatus Dependentiae bacterium]